VSDFEPGFPPLPYAFDKRSLILIAFSTKATGQQKSVSFVPAAASKAISTSPVLLRPSKSNARQRSATNRPAGYPTRSPAYQRRTQRLPICYASIEGIGESKTACAGVANQGSGRQRYQTSRLARRLFQFARTFDSQPDRSRNRP